MDVVFRLTLESSVWYFLLGYMSYFLWRFLRVLCMYVKSLVFGGCCCGVLLVLAPTCSVLSLLEECVSTELQCFVAFGGVC